MKSIVKASAVFMEKCIPLNTFIRKQERELSASNWEKENQGGTSIKNKELIEIKAEINEMRNKCTLGK